MNCTAKKGGTSLRFPLCRRSGVTRVELLAVLLICGVLFGGVSLSLYPVLYGPPSRETVKREGKYAAAWLQRIFYKAMLSGRSFSLYVASPSVPKRSFKVVWADPHEEEIYRGNDRIWFTNRSASPKWCVFSPKWNTLSPALTIEINASPDRRRPLHYIIISPYCRVSYRDTPPKD